MHEVEMRVLFLHGYGSKPGGVKPQLLQQHGYDVLNPVLPAEDFVASVAAAQEEFDKHQPEVVIGSSRGGAVAMNINTAAVPLILLAPAWKRWGTAITLKAAVTILHSEHDDVIPIRDSRELLRNSGLSKECLVVVGADHNMVDQAALAALLRAVRKAFGG
jgi:alpha-beta hydrolase superfamily lysophospholipase